MNKNNIKYMSKKIKNLALMMTLAGTIGFNNVSVLACSDENCIVCEDALEHDHYEDENCIECNHEIDDNIFFDLKGAKIQLGLNGNIIRKLKKMKEKIQRRVKNKLENINTL